MTVLVGGTIAFVQAVKKIEAETFDALGKKVDELSSTEFSKARASRKFNELAREFYNQFQERVKREYPGESYRILVAFAIRNSHPKFYELDRKQRSVRKIMSS